jgi:outer membrane lipoprotein-sorting protein
MPDTQVAPRPGPHPWLRAILLSLGLAVATAAAEPALDGDAALAALAKLRPAMQAAEGEAIRTVRRADQPDEPGEPWKIVFLIAAAGRYDLVMTRPDEPEGERRRYRSDGVASLEVEALDAQDDKPTVHRAKAGERDGLVRRLFASLRLDPAELGREFAATWAAEGDGFVLGLVPRDPAVRREIARLTLTLAADGTPRRMVLDEPDGNRHEVAIRRFAVDPAIPEGRFTLP